MKKMMFNDRYGLTEAVLQGRKTVTRRVGGKIRGLEDAIRCGYTRFDYKKFGDLWLHNDRENGFLKYEAPYKIGEIVAVAQSYDYLDDNYYYEAFEQLTCAEDCEGNLILGSATATVNGFVVNRNEYNNWVEAMVTHKNSAGFFNKMFVKADLMPHKIRILDVRAEQLQAITDEDCLREGVLLTHTWGDLHDLDGNPIKRHLNGFTVYENIGMAREAYAALIDKISGKGTWQANPYVWRIEFELIKS